MSKPYNVTDSGSFDRLGFSKYLSGLEHYAAGGGCNPACPEQWIDRANKIVWLSRPLFSQEKLKPEFQSYQVRILKSMAAPTLQDLSNSLSGLGVDFQAFNQKISSLESDVVDAKKAATDAADKNNSGGLNQQILIAGGVALAAYVLLKK